MQDRLSTNDRFAPLYPPGSADLAITPCLPVPRFPAAPARRNETGVHDFYTDRLLAEYAVPGTPDRVALVDKLFPHARFDAMLLAANDEVRTATVDLHPRTLSWVLSRGSEFVQYVRSPSVRRQFGLDDAELHLCFNYDLDTVDRDNAMFYDKRFHLHLNCWPRRDLAGLVPVPFGSVQDVVMRRRIIDPLAYLSARVLRDLFGGSIEGRRLLVEPEEAPGAPIGLSVRLGGWTALADGSAAQILTRLHRAAQEAYDQIREAFVGPAPSGMWQRPCLRPQAEVAAALDQISWLAAETRAGLVALRGMLRDLAPGEVDAVRTDSERAVRTLTLAGLDYSVGFSEAPPPESGRDGRDSGTYTDEDPDVLLTLQCRLLGDVGGAGLPPLRGVRAARLDRKAGKEMSEAEISERSAFLQGFRAVLPRHQQVERTGTAPA